MIGNTNNNLPSYPSVNGGLESTSHQSIRLVNIVDRDESVRSELGRCLDQNEIHWAGYQSAEDFLGRFKPDVTSCIILELSLPDRIGHDVVTELKSRDISIPTIFMSSSASLRDASLAFRAGAVDFLRKPIDCNLFITRVNEAISIHRKTEELRQRIQETHRRIHALSPRQRQVMELVCDGLPTKVIARQLDISQKTVEVHRSRVSREMGVNSVPRLVRMVTEYRLSNDALSRLL